jgi:prepilin-type N-terminal cleavage/methylation domain-containing protein
MKINNHNGFTLVEILVAATIFSFAVLGLAIGTVNVIQTNRYSYLHSTATNLAMAKLEELRAMTSAAFAGLSCPCNDSPLASGTTYSRSWQITANSPVTGVNRIDVLVNWRDYASRSVTVSASVPQ